MSTIFTPKRTRGLLLTFGLLFLSLYTAFWVFYFAKPTGVAAAWFDDTFAYRNAIPISSHTAAETNVYISATIDTSASGQFQSDCGDLRFTDSGGNLLPYFISSGCGTATTVVHVFFDSFPAGAQTIYYYYGNPSAANGFSSSDFATQATNYAVGSVASQEKTTGPVAYWKFDEGAGTTTQDSSQNGINLAITGTTWKTDSECLTGKCLYFDGSGDYLRSTNSKVTTIESGTSATYSVWFKTGDTNTGTTYPNLMGIRTGSTPYDIFNLRLYQNRLEGEIYENNSNANISWSTSVIDNQWHHAALVKNGSSDAYLYIDGILRASVTGKSWGQISNTEFLVGARTTSAGFFIGFLDEAKIYNYARSAAQIKADYAAGKARQASNKGTSASFGGANPDVVGPLSDGLVGYWKLDEASWTNDCSTATVTDSSGNGNNGKSCPAGTGPTGGSVGKFGNAGSFDGTEDYINLSGTSIFSPGTGDITVSAWINTSDNTLAAQTVYSDYGSSNEAVIVQEISTGINFYIRDTNSNNISVTGTTIPTNNTWYHVVGVKSGKTATVYINGTLGATNSNTSLVSVDTSSATPNIGRNVGGGAAFWKGSIDEVRIYNRALSPKEIRDLYNWAPGPVGWWKMDEKNGSTVNDSSGNGNTGSFGGGAAAPIWSQGKFGEGIFANVGNQYLTVANESNFDFTSDFTISTWINVDPTNSTSYRGVLGKYNATASGWDLGVQSGGARMSLRGTSKIDTGAIGSLGTGSWHHLSIVNTNSSIKMYIDGILTNTTSGTWTSTTNNTSVTVGNRDANTYTTGFIGKLDDTRFYNYARTQKQIVEDMNAGHPAVGSPVGSAVGYWKFDEGYGGTAYNSGNGGSDLAGTLSGTVPTWNNSGKFGKALQFTSGVNQYVNRTDNDSLDLRTGSMTLSAWIKTSTTGATQTIIRKDNGAGFSGYIFRIETDNRLRISYADADSSASSYATAGLVTDSQWHYITAVYNRDLDTQYLYVDGRQVDSDVPTITGDVNNSNPFRIGGTNTTTETFGGLIDEVKIYNYALTADEIKLDYNRGSAQVLGTLSDTSGLTGGSVASSSAAAAYCIPGSSDSCAAPVAEYNFDEKTGQTTYDSSGNGNSATLGANSSPGSDDPTWVSAKTGGGLSFDGSNDYSFAADSSSLNPSAFTIELWLKKNSEPSNFARILNKVKSDSTAGWSILFDNLSTKKVYLSVKNTAGGDLNTNGANATLPVGVWRHYAYTFDGSTTITPYENGVKLTSTSYTGTYASAPNNLVFAATDIPGQFSPITIDQVRIFNYARTPAQIAWDYNRGGPIAHYKFDECQGSTAYDSSGNGNNGTITIGATGSQASVGTCAASAATAWYNGATGKFNSSLNFDGTDDVVTVANTLSNTGSVSFWAKPTSSTTSMLQLTTTATVTATGGTVSAGAGFTSPTIYVNGIVNGTLSANAWNHIVITTGTGISANAIKFGLVGSTYFSGQIDDVRIFNYALAATQIKQLFNQGSAVRFGPATGSP